MIVCPSCWCQNEASSTACWNCRGSLVAPAARTPKRVPRPQPTPTAEERLAAAFVCPKGCVPAPRSKRAPAPPKCLARSLAIEQRRYAAITCARCGLTELYDLDLLAGPDRAGATADAPVGG